MAIKLLKTKVSDVHGFDSLVKANAWLASVRASVRSMLAPHRYCLKVIGSAETLDRVRLDLLQKHHVIADDFGTKLDLLDALKMQLRYNFGGMQGVADSISQLEEMRTYIGQKLDSSTQYIQDTAAKHVPATFTALTSPVVDRVRHEVGTSCAKFSDSTWLSVVDGAPVFTRYLGLYQFKDDTGHTHPEYWVVFTHNADTSESAVTCLNEFLMPTKFKPGQVVDSVDEAIGIVGQLLDAENFSALSAKLPMPQTSFSVNDLLTSRRYVVDVRVVDNEIKVKLALGVGKSKVNAVVTKLTDDIRGVLSKFVTGVLKYKTRWYGRQYLVTYTLVHPVQGPKLVTQQQLDGLRNLGFDTVDVQKLQQLLGRG